MTTKCERVVGLIDLYPTLTSLMELTVDSPWSSSESVFTAEGQEERSYHYFSYDSESASPVISENSWEIESIRPHLQSALDYR